MKRKEKKRPKQMRPAAMREYRDRNVTLRALGWTSYDAYLQSDLWAAIRSRIMKGSPRCYGCEAKASQVHHGCYSAEVLAGESDGDLFPVCARCHARIEFHKSGKKRAPSVATSQLKSLRKRQAKRQGKSRRRRRRAGGPTLDEQWRDRCR